MVNPLHNNLADQLLADNFTQSGPTVGQLSDPLVDTPMVLTLDQLKPYDHNPRVTRNPKYDDIKASIRERGLDASPPVTRRPGESHFMIRNGGNTRLTILWELWQETQDKQFYEINCLFKPWQNEIIALTGHLAEDALHGQLSFIEKSLGVFKASELYCQEFSIQLSQRQLAQKLTHDGYPVSQTTISLMQEVINYLIPVIPESLYGELSRTFIERLLRLRKVANNVWLNHTQETQEQDHTFNDMFEQVLSLLSHPSKKQGKILDFSLCEDELINKMAHLLECSYSQIAAELAEKEKRQKILEVAPQDNLHLDEVELFAKNIMQEAITESSQTELDEDNILSLSLPHVTKPTITVNRTYLNEGEKQVKPIAEDNSNNMNDISIPELSEQDVESFIRQHIVSDAESTPRIDAIQNMIGQLTGEETQDFKSNVLQSIPVQAGGLYPIADIWHISASLDNQASLRMHIGQLVLEIAQDMQCADRIETTNRGIGFVCVSEPFEQTGVALMQLLKSLSDNIASDSETFDARKVTCLITGLNQNLLGVHVLSDVSFVKLMRVLRLIRRFHELEQQ